MKHYTNLLMGFVAMMALVACNHGPNYLYVDNQSDEPKPCFVESDNDTEAYNNA